MGRVKSSATCTPTVSNTAVDQTYTVHDYVNNKINKTPHSTQVKMRWQNVGYVHDNEQKQ